MQLTKKLCNSKLVFGNKLNAYNKILQIVSVIAVITVDYKSVG